MARKAILASCSACQAPALIGLLRAKKIVNLGLLKFEFEFALLVVSGATGTTFLPTCLDLLVVSGATRTRARSRSSSTIACVIAFLIERNQVMLIDLLLGLLRASFARHAHSYQLVAWVT